MGAIPSLSSIEAAKKAKNDLEFAGQWIVHNNKMIYHVIHSSLSSSQLDVLSMAGYDTDDLLSEGYLATLSALQSYDPSRGMRFSTFCSIAVASHLRDLHINVTRKKRNILAETSVGDLTTLDVISQPYTVVNDWQRTENRIFCQFVMRLLCKRMDPADYSCLVETLKRVCFGYPVRQWNILRKARRCLNREKSECNVNYY